MTLQAAVTAVGNAIDTHAIETAVISGLLVVSKAWDRLYGHRKDREMRSYRIDVQKRLDAHNASDAEAFQSINATLARLDATLNNGLREDVKDIKDRLNRMDDRALDQAPRGRRRS